MKSGVCTRIFSCVASCVVLLSSSASASLTIYSDRSAWEAAAGGLPAIFQDFNSISADILVPPAFDLGAFSLDDEGSGSRIDASPFFDATDTPSPDDYVVDGTTYFLASTEDADAPEGVIVQFDQPVISWGVDQNPHPLDVGDFFNFRTDTGETGIWTLQATDTTHFRGFVASMPFTSVIFAFGTGSRGIYVEAGWDNVGAHVASIPEPTALLLLCLGFAGIAFARKRLR